ncbi:sigma factor, partial [Staphylococcus aureus]
MRQFGAHRLAIIEDAIGQALLEGITSWRMRGVPPNARAWLHRAARHRVIDDLRRRTRDQPLDAQPESATEPELEPAVLANDI